MRSSKHGAISNGNLRLLPNSGPSTVPSGYFWISGLLTTINFHQPQRALVKIPAAEGGTKFQGSAWIWEVRFDGWLIGCQIGQLSTGSNIPRCRVLMAMWGHRLVPSWLTWLISMCYASMVKGVAWASVLPLWAWKCARWSLSNFPRRKEQSWSSTT